jgi:hypothetical protein
MMFDFVEPHDGPVVVGLEKFETVYAKNQPQYHPLRTLPGRQGDSAIGRFHANLVSAEGRFNTGFSSSLT